jgi:hypothetical protein
MTILVLGDSHSNMFAGMPDAIWFDLRKCQQVLFTAHRFNNSQDEDLWNLLDQWFSENTINSDDPSRKLVITAGEVDLRAHYWRHIPRHYQIASDIIKYIRAQVEEFYNTLNAVCNKYALEHIVVWSHPVAGERAHYNSHHPFSGSSQTRNQLIHIWNREFFNIIKNDQCISLATAYYDYIDPSNYTTADPAISPDGVHWRESVASTFWNTLILPGLESPGIYAGGNWDVMYNDKFDMCDSISTGIQQYDTWVRSDQLQNTEDLNRFIYINGNTYAWLPANQRFLLPENYVELSLQKV